VFGHKWEPAEGTIVEVRPAETAFGRASGHGLGPVYAVDVRQANGEVARATVTGPAGPPLAVGTTVRLEVNAKSGEARFDPSAGNFRAGGVRDAMKLAEQIRQAQRAGGGAAAAALSGFPQGMHIQPGMPGQPGASGMRVVGGGEAAELVQELLSGNAADRAAAIERLKGLRSGAAGQASVPAGPANPLTPPGGFNPPPAFDQAGGVNTPPAPRTFDPVGGFSTPPAPRTFDQAGAFNTPPAPSTFGQVGGFDQPPAPSTFDPVGGFGTAGSVGQAGQASAADRIAKLQELRDKGLITGPEFEAQRQRILGEI
jgi:Short C-terminal domain